jgi:outer membrane protein OmpA-like peptidoglycan-associated protein
MRLSQQRAWSVETWLVQNAGLPASVFSPAGYGATNPVAPNETPDGHDDPDGRQRNRRVEIVIPK